LQATGPKGQKARFACGQALLEGIHLVQTWVGNPALKTLITSELGLQNPEIAQAVYDHVEICPETRVYQLDKGLWDLLSDLVNAPQIAGLLDLPESALNPQKSVATISGDVIILDRIQDAGNVGSILRTRRFLVMSLFWIAFRMPVMSALFCVLQLQLALLK